MRPFLHLICLFLYLVALVGVGVGIAIVYAAAQATHLHAEAADVGVWLAAIITAAPPFMVGIIALSGGAIVTAVLRSADEQVQAMRALTNATLKRGQA